VVNEHLAAVFIDVLCAVLNLPHRSCTERFVVDRGDELRTALASRTPESKRPPEERAAAKRALRRRRDS
jgi:hypothetical protein